MWCLQCFDWLGGRKGMPVKKLCGGGADVVVCLELGADLRMPSLMLLPLTVSCFINIQIFTFLVPACPGNPWQRAVKWVCVCCNIYCIYCVAYTILGSSCHKVIFSSVGLEESVCWYHFLAKCLMQYIFFVTCAWSSGGVNLRDLIIPLLCLCPSYIVLDHWRHYCRTLVFFAAS